MDEVPAILRFLVTEISRRYNLFTQSAVRNIDSYNDYLKYAGETPLPHIIAVVEDLFDVLTRDIQVEEQLKFISNRGYVAGVHLIISSQHISANRKGIIDMFDAKIILPLVAEDNRAIAGEQALSLKNPGELQIITKNSVHSISGQCAYVSDSEVSRVGNYFRSNNPISEDVVHFSQMDNSYKEERSSISEELYERAVEVVLDVGFASSSVLARKMGLSYPQACRLIDLLEQRGIIGPFQGSKPREILIDKNDLYKKKKGKRNDN